jgi:hypothetical protein
LRRHKVNPDNVALVPASLLPYKAQWQRIANELPVGSVLIIAPLAGPRHATLQHVATQLRSRGRRVRTLPARDFPDPAWVSVEAGHALQPGAG